MTNQDTNILDGVREEVVKWIAENDSIAEGYLYNRQYSESTKKYYMEHCEHNGLFEILDKAIQRAHSQGLQAERDKAKEVIRGLVLQFGFSTIKNKKLIVDTGGMMDLEAGFDYLGWTDPHEEDLP